MGEFALYLREEILRKRVKEILLASRATFRSLPSNLSQSDRLSFCIKFFLFPVRYEIGSHLLDQIEDEAWHWLLRVEPEKAKWLPVGKWFDSLSDTQAIYFITRAINTRGRYR